MGPPRTHHTAAHTRETPWGAGAAAPSPPQPCGPPSSPVAPGGPQNDDFGGFSPLSAAQPSSATAGGCRLGRKQLVLALFRGAPAARPADGGRGWLGQAAGRAGGLAAGQAGGLAAGCPHSHPAPWRRPAQLSPP